MFTRAGASFLSKAATMERVVGETSESLRPVGESRNKEQKQFIGVW
jgi:hypothetical protein